jgi:RNA polymerase sigma-70 factor (family 1)
LLLKNQRLLLSNSTPYTDKELLLLVAEGDETAFRQLYLQWHQLLAGYVFRITESRELTEEIVQDVFMNIWRVRETLAEINNFKHFLLVVSRNRAFDVLKKQLKEKKLEKIWEKENMSELPIAVDDAEVSPYSLIDQAIDSLPPRRKEVYLLSRHERIAYKEIANRLGISKESVKTHLKLANNAISVFIHSNLPEITVLFINIFINF